MNLNEIVQRVYGSPTLRTHLKIDISGDPKKQKQHIRAKLSALSRQNPTFRAHLIEQIKNTPAGK